MCQRFRKSSARITLRAAARKNAARSSEAPLPIPSHAADLAVILPKNNVHAAAYLLFSKLKNPASCASRIFLHDCTHPPSSR
jgi:hypothetical protein